MKLAATEFVARVRGDSQLRVKSLTMMTIGSAVSCAVSLVATAFFLVMAFNIYRQGIGHWRLAQSLTLVSALLFAGAAAISMANGLRNDWLLYGRCKGSIRQEKVRFCLYASSKDAYTLHGLGPSIVRLSIRTEGLSNNASFKLIRIRAKDFVILVRSPDDAPLRMYYPFADTPPSTRSHQFVVDSDGPWQFELEATTSDKLDESCPLTAIVDITVRTIAPGNGAGNGCG